MMEILNARKNPLNVRRILQTESSLMGNKWSSRLFIRNAFRCSQNFTALAVKGFKQNIQKDCKSKKKLQLINNKLDFLM